MTREEALKILRETHDLTSFSVRTALETILPELKESEDDKVINIIKLALMASEDYLDSFYVVHDTSAKKCIDWLEKQKESLHIPETCKENADSFTDEDERIRKELVYFIQKEKEYMESKVKPENSPKLMFLMDALAYLEKQKEQKPSISCGHENDIEWSENDRGVLLSVKCVIDEVWHSKNNITDYSTNELEEMWHWLDALWQKVEYPSPHWKPSEEQMKKLRIAIKLYDGDFGGAAVKPLEELYEELKKL